jgi:hypothetical protein
MRAMAKAVPQDEAEAVALWRNAVALWRKAADEGDADAQNALGEAYKHGRGVPQDDAQAVALWRKARDKMVKNRDDVAAKMTPAQNAEVQLTAREWRRGTEANIAVDKVAKQTALGVFFTAAEGVFQALFTDLWVMLCFLFVLYIFLFGFVIPPIGFRLYYSSRLIRHKPWALEFASSASCFSTDRKSSNRNARWRSTTGGASGR